jgi:hypothetical protein
MAKDAQKAEQAQEAQEAIKGEIAYYEGFPMSIHSNMQKGIFTEYGDNDTKKEKLEVRVLGWRGFKGKMYQKVSDEQKDIKTFMSELKCDEETAKAKEVEKNTKDWLELYFINNEFKDENGRKNPLCVMLLKTYSLANFDKELKKWSYKFKANGKPVKIEDLVITMTTKNENKNGKDFYVVEFKFKISEDEEMKEAIENFYATKPHIYAQDNLEEILRNQDTYLLKKTKNWSLPADLPNRDFYLKMPVVNLIESPKEPALQEQE